MARGVVFVPRTLRSASVSVVTGVVDVHTTILRCFIAPDVVGDVLAVESAGDVGAPRWLVSPPVPVFVVITTTLAVPVAIFVVVLVLLGGMLLPLLTWLHRVHIQFLL